MKIFSTPFGGTPEARALFASEWERLKKVQHPAIAKCYGGGFEETDAYLAHELIDGETLRSQLERRTRLSWETVLDMADTLADALNYLHCQGLIHGRLGPDSIMISGLSPVLIDVRVDRRSTVFRRNRPPSSREIAIMAPELVKDSTAYSPQSDLYSLGATLYLALTGRPPASGETTEEVSANVLAANPPSPASIVLECPVWLDKLVMHLLQKDPAARPHGAAAVQLALAEVRRRSMSRAGVAEHASAGFSALNVTNQNDREVARQLLGRDAVSFENEKVASGIAWHDRPLVLVVGLALLVALFAYVLWPLNEDQMRQRAEDLITQQTRTSMHQAKVGYLEPMLQKYPDGQHAQWAREQIDQVEMYQAERALDVKLKRNLPLQNEGERLYAEANRYERFGDASSALDRYRSMLTLLGDDPRYRPFVNLARRQIARIEHDTSTADEASRIIEGKLSQADALMRSGKVVAARKIWYSIVELYGNNDNVGPLVARAQEQLAGAAAGSEETK